MALELRYQIHTRMRDRAKGLGENGREFLVANIPVNNKMFGWIFLMVVLCSNNLNHSCICRKNYKLSETGHY